MVVLYRPWTLMVGCPSGESGDEGGFGGVTVAVADGSPRARLQLPGVGNGGVGDVVVATRSLLT